MKTIPTSWFWVFENAKKCDRSESQIPGLSDYLQIHIRLTYHPSPVFSASEFVWLSHEWWKLKSCADMYSMWKITPGSLRSERPRGTGTHSHTPRQTHWSLRAHLQPQQTLCLENSAVCWLDGKPWARFSGTSQEEMGSNPSPDHRKNTFNHRTGCKIFFL